MSFAPRRRSRAATLFDTADWLDPITPLAALKDPDSTVRMNATKPVGFSVIAVTFPPIETSPAAVEHRPSPLPPHCLQQMAFRRDQHSWDWRNFQAAAPG